jgi:HK97 family phage major capsid protein
LTYNIDVIAPGASGKAEPQDFGRLLAELEDAGHDIDGDDSVCFVMRPRVMWDVIGRRADAVTANDGKGGFVFSLNRSQIENGQPARILGYRALTSTHIPDEREVVGGTSSSESDKTLILCGKFREWIIARQPAIELMLSPHASTAFAQDESLLRSIMFLDAAPRHASAFAILDGITEPS